MKGKPERQHWVPLFYLRYFATPETRESDNPQGWFFSKHEGDPGIVNLRKICAQRHLYSPKNIEGKRDWKTEDKLQHLEDLMASIWPLLANGFVDFEQNKSLRKGLALFISTLLLRHPSNTKEIKELHGKLTEFYETLPKDTAGNPYISEVIHKGKVISFDNSGYEEYKKCGKNEFQRMFIDSLHSNAVPFAEILMEKRWSVIFCDKPLFITTDKPVVIENTERQKFGLKTKGTIITFPLSPTRILVMDDRHDQPNGRYYPLGDHGPGPINLALWRCAENFMISPRHTDDVCAEMVLWADECEKGDD